MTAVEIRALKEVQQIVELGKTKGFLTLDDVTRLLPTDTISADDLDDVMALLGALDIELVEDPAADDEADVVDTDGELDEEPLAVAESDEPAAASASMTGPADPVRCYFDEM